MPNSFMVTNRNRENGGFGIKRDELRYYIGESTSDLSNPRNWTECSENDFVSKVSEQTAKFPHKLDHESEDQQHLTMFIHGYDNDWKSSAERYITLQKELYSGSESLGILVLFSWPSNGNVAAYLADREDAEESGPDLLRVLNLLYEKSLAMQKLAAQQLRKGNIDPSQTTMCKAKISVIAHSMGNYLVEKGLSSLSKRINNPQLFTLVHQLVMAAADVDNDLFDKDLPHGNDGSLMANLCYRISALYTGRDPVLGSSALLKHFGTRRLGRSGLPENTKVYDNVCEFDITKLISNGCSNVHGAVFTERKVLDLVRTILCGVDRGIAEEKHIPINT